MLADSDESSELCLRIQTNWMYAVGQERRIADSDSLLLGSLCLGPDCVSHKIVALPMAVRYAARIEVLRAPLLSTADLPSTAGSSQSHKYRASHRRHQCGKVVVYARMQNHKGRNEYGTNKVVTMRKI